MLAADQEEIHNEALKSLMETHKVGRVVDSTNCWLKFENLRCLFFEISGFPLNFSYTTTEDIIEAVRATNVWKNFHPDVEFALAVHIHPYPNGILSVWVYIASLIKRRWEEILALTQNFFDLPFSSHKLTPLISFNLIVIKNCQSFYIK